MFIEFFRRIFRKRGSGLIPEKYFAVSVGSKVIGCKDPKGKITKINVAILEQVAIVTNDTGPWGMDFWLVLESGGERIAVPQAATGENELISFLQNLPSFDNDNFIKANTCVESAEFVCWKRTA